MTSEQIPSFHGLTEKSRNYAIERQLNGNHLIVFMPMDTSIRCFHIFKNGYIDIKFLNTMPEASFLYS